MLLTTLKIHENWLKLAWNSLEFQLCRYERLLNIGDTLSEHSLCHRLTYGGQSCFACSDMQISQLNTIASSFHHHNRRCCQLSRDAELGLNCSLPWQCGNPIQTTYMYMYYRWMMHLNTWIPYSLFWNNFN